jgi:hypothetical protein
VTLSFFCQIAVEYRGKDLPTEVGPLDDIAKLAQRLEKTVRYRFGSAREIRRYHDRLAEEFNASRLSAPNPTFADFVELRVFAEGFWVFFFGRMSAKRWRRACERRLAVIMASCFSRRIDFQGQSGRS